MRRLPKPGRYPEFPSTDEPGEFAPSKQVVFIARVIFVILCMMIVTGLVGLLFLMIKGVAGLAAQ